MMLKIFLANGLNRISANLKYKTFLTPYAITLLNYTSRNLSFVLANSPSILPASTLCKADFSLKISFFSQYSKDDFQQRALNLSNSFFFQLIFSINFCFLCSVCLIILSCVKCSTISGSGTLGMSAFLSRMANNCSFSSNMRSISRFNSFLQGRLSSLLVVDAPPMLLIFS